MPMSMTLNIIRLMSRRSAQLPASTLEKAIRGSTVASANGLQSQTELRLHRPSVPRTSLHLKPMATVPAKPMQPSLAVCQRKAAEAHAALVC